MFLIYIIHILGSFKNNSGKVLGEVIHRSFAVLSVPY